VKIGNLLILSDLYNPSIHIGGFFYSAGLKRIHAKTQSFKNQIKKGMSFPNPLPGRSETETDRRACDK